MNRNTRTRRACISAGIALAGAAAAACGSGSAGSGPAGSAAGAAPAVGLRSGVTLAFAHGASNDAEVNSREANLKAFQAQYPQIKVEHNAYQGGADAKLDTLMSAGTPPDVFYVGNGAQLTTRAARGQLQDLGPLTSRDKFDTKDMFESAVALYQFCGKQYAYPIDFPYQALYYNLDLFEQAGVKPPPNNWNDATWKFDRFLDTAKRVTKNPEAGGQWGYLTGHTGFRNWWVWLAANGGELFDKDLKTCTINDAPAVEALQFLQDLVFKNRVMPAPAQATEAGGTLNGFLNSRLAITTLPPWMGQVRDGLKQRWDVAPHPRGNNAKARWACTGGGTGLALASPAAGGKNLNEAWELLKFLESRPQVESYITTVGIVPPLKSVANSTVFADPSQPPKGIKVFTDGAQYLRPDPSIVRWSDINRAFTDGLKQLWDNSQNAKSVADAIKQQVDVILKEIQSSGEMECK